MANNSKEPVLTYALNPDGRMVYVLDVPNGLDCNCICPKCKQPLIARNNDRNIRQKHFQHYGEKDGNTEHKCEGCYMTALHLMAEQIIQEKKEVMAPSYKEMKAHIIKFSDVVSEEYYENTGIKPDVIGITQNGGYKCCIEIRNTSAVRDVKRKKIVDLNLICMEIDVRDMLLEDLEDFITNSTEYRKWINNPIYENYSMTKESASKDTSCSGKSGVNDADKYCNSLHINDAFPNEKRQNTVICNFGKTQSSSGVVVLHVTRNYPYTFYLTLVTFPYGQPQLQTMQPIKAIFEAEKSFYEFKAKY